MGTSHHHHKKVIKCNVLISWLILLCTWWLKKYIWYIYMELYIVHIIQPASIEKLRARIWWISLGEDKILPQRCGYFYNLYLPYIHTYIFKINLYLYLWQFAQTTHPIIELRLQNLLPAKSWGKSPQTWKWFFIHRYVQNRDFLLRTKANDFWTTLFGMSSSIILTGPFLSLRTLENQSGMK